MNACEFSVPKHSCVNGKSFSCQPVIGALTVATDNLLTDEFTDITTACNEETATVVYDD